MRFSLFTTIAAAAGLMQLAFAAPAPAAGMELVEALTSKLGITADQAAGGAGALFSLAKQQLSSEDFAKVAEAIPDAGALIEKAPKSSGSGGAMGQVSSMLGGQGAALEGVAGLGEAFSALGLDADMVGKFVPVVLDFAQAKGGDTVMKLLQGVLP